jgi:uncharacterized protein YkwD
VIIGLAGLLVLALVSACDATQAPGESAGETTSPTATVSSESPVTTFNTTSGATTPTHTASITASPTIVAKVTLTPTQTNAPKFVSPTPTAIIAPTPTPERVPGSPQATTIAPADIGEALTAVPVVTVAGVGAPDAEEQLFLGLLNQYRKANGRQALAFEPLLFKSARWMAQDMAAKNSVSHIDSQGRDIFNRIKAFGYPGRWVGENIAGGFEHAADNLKIWQSDDIHKNNLLGANYTKVGVGRFYSPKSFNQWNWVLDLG